MRLRVGLVVSYTGEQSFGTKSDRERNSPSDDRKPPAPIDSDDDDSDGAPDADNGRSTSDM